MKTLVVGLRTSLVTRFGRNKYKQKISCNVAVSSSSPLGLRQWWNEASIYSTEKRENSELRVGFEDSDSKVYDEEMD